MAVADLGLQLSDYRTAAIADIGYGSTAYASLEAGESAEIDRLILRGERTFWLHPPGVSPPHVWSCLRDPGLLDLWIDVAVAAAVTATGVYDGATYTVITATTASFYETMIGKSIIVTTIGTYTIVGYTSSTVVSIAGNHAFATKTFSIDANGDYQLPADFDSPDSAKLVCVSDSWVPDVQLIDEQTVNAFRATQTQTGYPQYAAIRWKACDGTAAHVQEIMFWPEPNAYYQVAMPCILRPQGMSAANPYPRGGPEMADCLLSVILAVCEEAKTGRRGDRWAEAAAKCAAAAQRDRTRHHNFIAGQMCPDAGRSGRLFDVKRLILPV